MSGRGRGRGGGGGRTGGGRSGGGRGGGGRGPPRDQPAPSPSPSYGRGAGGRGPTGPASYQASPAVLQPVVPVTYSAPTPSAVASSSTSSLSIEVEVETKLTLESPAHSVQQPEKEALAVQQPVSKLPPASSKSYGIPARPGYGKEGRKCIVRANHFLVTVADKDPHHYDVSIAYKPHFIKHNTHTIYMCVHICSYTYSINHFCVHIFAHIRICMLVVNCHFLPYVFSVFTISIFNAFGWPGI